MEEINELYQAYKKKHNLVDVADMEDTVLASWDDGSFAKYNDVSVDDFIVDEISFIKSKKQEKILDKLDKYKKMAKEATSQERTKVIQPSNVVFDSIDEVKTALKIARKLLEEGESADEVLIVASVQT